MKHLLLALLILPLSACYKLDGNLSVKEHLVYKKGKNVDLLMKGDYNAQAKISKEKIKLKLKGPFATKRITLKFPEGTILPQDSGTFSFKAAQIGQPFDLEGDLAQTVTRSETVTATEVCFEPIYDQYCRGPYNYVGLDNYYYGPNSFCGGSNLRGKREVRFHTKTTTTNFDLDLVQEAASKATYKGAAVDTKKVYEFYGACRI